MMIDPATGEYVASNKKADSEVTDILKEKDWGKKLAALRESQNPQAQFLWAVLRDSFHSYRRACPKHRHHRTRHSISPSAGATAGMQGPLEIWQAAGVQQVAEWIQADIDAGNTMSNAALPEWLKGVEAFHNNEGSLNFTTGQYDRAQRWMCIAAKSAPRRSWAKPCRLWAPPRLKPT